jgi:hypothetical protein
MWNRIAGVVAQSQNLDEWESARLYALLNIALTDGYIASFDSKYFYKFWRPVTAIQDGNADGNPQTVGDPNWMSLVITPPIPNYDSGHAVEGGTASRILRRFFRNDKISFHTCSTTLPAGQTCYDPSPRTRVFHSFSEAAAENGLSSILVGFHFRYAVEVGIEHRHRVADWVITHELRPIEKCDDDFDGEVLNSEAQ